MSPTDHEKDDKTMRTNNFRTTLSPALRLAGVLLLGAVGAFAQVALTAGPTTVTLPDGTIVPMWGYSCGAVTPPATCALPRQPDQRKAGGTVRALADDGRLTSKRSGL